MRKWPSGKKLIPISGGRSNVKVRLLFESLSSILETENMFMSELKPTAGGGMVSVLFNEQTFFVKIESTEPDRVKVWMDSNLIVNQKFQIINENVDESGIRHIASEISQAIVIAGGPASAASSNARAQFIKKSSIAPMEAIRIEAMERLLDVFHVELETYGFKLSSSEITENGILMDIRQGSERDNRLGVQFYGKDIRCSLNGVSLSELVTFDEFTLSPDQIHQILNAVMEKVMIDHAQNEDDLASLSGYTQPGRIRPARRGDTRGDDRIYDVASEGLDGQPDDGMAARGRTAGALYTQPFFQVLLRLLNILVGDDLEPLDGETVQMLRNIVDVIKSTPFPR